jgi:hypothetical protein
LFKPDVKRDIERFVHAIDGLDWTLSASMEALRTKKASTNEDLEQKAKEFFKGSEKNDIQAVLHQILQWRESVFLLKRIDAGQEVAPRSFLVALISQYDAYLGNLLKSLLSLRPELLESSERSLTFAELCKFKSIDDAREYILEKEVESFLRKSHSEQFSWLEKKFGINLKTDLLIWPTFIEITERRNLYVHTDATVSTQYLEVCGANGALGTEIKIGDQLEMTGNYFQIAYEAIYEVGVKLGQVLWRKLMPDQAREADEALTSITYFLLDERRLNLAKALLTFADVTLGKRHADEYFRLIFLINRALVSYLAGEKAQCLKILDTQDFSAVSNLFKLAELVLREKFDNAGELMKEIGNKNRPFKFEYLNWPLFEVFRNTEQFASAFQELFGEVTPKDVEATKES